MYKRNPSDFWTPVDEMGEYDGMPGLSLNLTYCETDAKTYPTVFDPDHKVMGIIGATSSGKTTMLGLLAYQYMSKYNPERCKLMVYDCRDDALTGVFKELFPHNIQTCPVGGTSKEYRMMFLDNVKDNLQAKKQADTILVMVDAGGLMSDGDAELSATFYDVVKLVRSTPRAYLVYADSYMSREQARRLNCDIMVCMRTSGNIAKTFVGTDAPCFITDKYGLVFTCTKESRGRLLRTTFIPKERFYDAEACAKMKESGKWSEDQATLLQRLQEKFSA